MLNRAFAGLCARFLQQQHKQFKTTTKFGPNAKKVYVFWNFSASIELQALEISHSSRSKMTICKWPFLGKKFLRAPDFWIRISQPRLRHNIKIKNKTKRENFSPKKKQTNQQRHASSTFTRLLKNILDPISKDSVARLYFSVCVFVLCFLSSRFPFARCQAKQTKRVRSFLSRFNVCILDCAPYGN